MPNWWCTRGVEHISSKVEGTESQVTVSGATGSGPFGFHHHPGKRDTKTETSWQVLRNDDLGARTYCRNLHHGSKARS